MKFLIASLSTLFLPLIAKAADLINSDLINAAAGGAGYNPSAGGPENLALTMGVIVQVVLSFVGTIFFVLVVYSGIQWMTAGGNEEKVTKARERLIQAAIGLAITLAAYFITFFISKTLGAA